MDERWSQTRCLDAFSDSALEAALCLQFELPTFEEEVNSAHRTIREWPDRILADRPNLAMRAFRGFLCPFFEKRASHISLLYELVNNGETLPWRGELALELLEKFSTAPPEALSKLLYAALSAESCRERLAGLTNRVVTARRQVRGEQRVLWMVTGFVLSPLDFYVPLKRYCGGREAALWTIKEFVEHVTNREVTGALPLTIDQRKSLTLLIGCRFVNTYHPLGGTCGHRNDWDAADFVRHQIDVLSAEASPEAGEALVALADNGKLSSYGDYLRHAIANQAKVRRQQQYEQPDWEKVVRTLQGGKPANIADLHALAIDHLKALRAEIRHSNVDTYKQFWRLSDRGSIERPQHEEICRDRLIELLRPRLSPLDVLADPEGHMAANKRADIVLYYRTAYKLPIEVKRHTHIDLWTACANQLDRLYACDP